MLVLKVLLKKVTFWRKQISKAELSIMQRVIGYCLSYLHTFFQTLCQKLMEKKAKMWSMSQKDFSIKEWRIVTDVVNNMTSEHFLACKHLLDKMIISGTALYMICCSLEYLDANVFAFWTVHILYVTKAAVFYSYFRSAVNSEPIEPVLNGLVQNMRA